MTFESINHADPTGLTTGMCATEFAAQRHASSSAKHANCRVAFVLLALVLCGCAARTVPLQPVPRDALSGSWGMVSRGGIYYVKFDTFKTWLIEGGAVAQNQALHDERTVEAAMSPDRSYMLWAADPWRVKDLAYQLLCRDRATAVRVDYNYANRDRLIAAYLNSRPTEDAR
jgi:hypothetical protein